MSTRDSRQNKIRVWKILALAAVVLAVAVPRLLVLDRYVTPDEQLWLARSANFYFALGQRDFANTYQVQHPGVTVMWAGTAALLLEFPQYRGSGMGQLRPEAFHRYLAERGEDSPLDLLVAARRMMVIAHTLLLGLAFWYAAELVGLLPAVVGFLLIAFDPFYLSLTRLLHLDGLLSSLVLLSLLALLAYLHGGNHIALVFSGLAAGLGWLTKTPALFLLPVASLVFLVVRWAAVRQAWHLRSASLLARTVWPLGAWLLLGMFVFFLFWPAMWVQPLETLYQVIGQAQVMADTGHDSAVFFNGRIYADGRLGLEASHFYPLVYLWRATPWTLIGLALAALGLRARLSPLNQPASRSLAFSLFFLAGFFFLAMTIPTKKFDRYLLPVFAPLDLLAGLGWVYAAARLASGARRWSRALPAAVVAGAVLLQGASALGVSPYYLNFYNPALGGIQRAAQVLQIGWGEGLDQAARYLNGKPGARRLKVSAWYADGSFSYYFIGQSRPLPYYSTLSEQEWQDFVTSDYAVIYVHQWQRQVPKPVLDHVARLEPEYTVSLNGFEYVRVYQLR